MDSAGVFLDFLSMQALVLDFFFFGRETSNILFSAYSSVELE